MTACANGEGVQMHDETLSVQIRGVLRAALVGFRDRPFDDMREGTRKP